MEQIISENTETLHFLLIRLPWILLASWTLYSIAVFVARPVRMTISNYYVIDSIPSVFVTLGLFGTFTGIAYGLLRFDTDPQLIKESIKILLDGLKLAMFTSITGILLSLIFAKIIKVAHATKQISEPDSKELFELQHLNRNFLDMKVELKNLNKGFAEFKHTLQTSHHDALVKSLREVLENFNEVFAGFIEDLVNSNFEELTKTIRELSSWQREHKQNVEDLTEAYSTLVNQHKEFVNKTFEWVQKLDEISGQSSKLQIVINEFNDTFQEDGNLSRLVREISQSANHLRETTANFSEMTDGMVVTTESIKEVGNSITSWVNKISLVSDQANAIVEQVSQLQHINGRFDERLTQTFQGLDRLLKAYIEDLENRLKK